MDQNQFENGAHREYSNAEYTNMFKCYIRQGENFPRAAADYAELFPNLRHPDHRVIRNVVNSIEETGCVNPHSRVRQLINGLIYLCLSFILNCTIFIQLNK